MITVTSVRYQGDVLTDTFSANMEQCNRYKQSIQELLQVHKKADKSEKETGNDNHRQPR